MLAIGSGVGAAAIAGAFDAKTPENTAEKSADQSTPGASSTATGSKPSGGEPEILTQVDAVDLALGNGVYLAEPTTMVRWERSPGPHL